MVLLTPLAEQYPSRTATSSAGTSRLISVIRGEDVAMSDLVWAQRAVAAVIERATRAAAAEFIRMAAALAKR